MYPTLSNKSKLQEIQEKLKEAELNDNKKDTEKYKKQLKEIEQQVIITGSLFFHSDQYTCHIFGFDYWG